MTPERAPLVGRTVPNQARLRPPRPMRTLDEFLVFLRRLRRLFGPDGRPRPPTIGDRFRL